MRFEAQKLSNKETINLLTQYYKDTYHLTDKGKVLSSFSTRDFYFNYFKNNNQMKIDDEHYWSLSEHSINYANIVSMYLSTSSSKLK